MPVRRFPSKQPTARVPAGRRLSLLLARCALLVALASTARADEDVAHRGSERWVPGVIVRSGLVIQNGSASHESSVPSGAIVRPPHTGRETLTWPLLGADLEVMSPEIPLVPGGPRIFGHAGASYSFATDEDITKEGEPKNFVPPIPNLALLVDGQGSSTNIQIKSPLWEAGLGVAFEFEAWDRPMRLRVSAEYMRERLKLRGKAHQAADLFGTVLLFSLRDTVTDDFDAVGGGLALEIDAGRAGAVVTSVIASGRFYRFVGGRGLSVDGSGEFGSTATWRYELDPWAYRVHAGFRLRWQPE